MKRYLVYIAVSFLFSGMLSAQKIDKNIMPKAGETPSVNIAKPKTFKLNNGLTVLVVENHKLPRVNVNLIIDRAPVFEGDIVGVGSIMSSQLGNGTSLLSKDEFNKKIDYLGAGLYFRTNGVYGNMLSKYFEDVMVLMADAIKNPKFDEKEIQKEIDRSIEGLKAQEKSAKAIAQDVYSALVYGKNTALGEFATKESLSKIKTADVQAYYQKHYIPNTAYLAIVGDVEFSKVKSLVKKLFKDWKAGNAKETDLSKQTNLDKTEIAVVDVPSAVQSVMYAGNIFKMKKSNPEYFSAKIGNYVLGGGSLESRLNRNLREKNAFTYGAYTRLSFYKYAQSFKANTSVRNEVVSRAVSELMNELKASKKITKEELTNAKAQLKGRFIRSLEDPETISGFAINTIVEGLPADFYANYLKSVDNVTQKSVEEAMSKIVLTDKERILVVGKGTAIADSLETLGYTVKYFDKNADITNKPVKKSIASGVTVKTVGDLYIKAIGGKAKVEKIKSLALDAVAKVQGMEMNMAIINAVGGKNKIEMKMMGNTVQKIVFDGKDGYIEAQGQKQPMPTEVKSKMAKNKDIFPELAFGEDKSYVLEGVEPMGGEDAYCIKNDSKSYFYSVATGLKIAEVETQKVGDKEMKVPVKYTDYKEVEGIKLPFKMIQSMMGQEIIFNINSYEINKATDADFK